MTWKNTTARWGGLSIGLHWLMLILMVGVYACIELKGYFPKDSEPRELLKQWHFMLGLSVFALVWLRLLARVIGPTPTTIPPSPATTWSTSRAAGCATSLAPTRLIGPPSTLSTSRLLPPSVE